MKPQNSAFHAFISANGNRLPIIYCWNLHAHSCEHSIKHSARASCPLCTLQVAFSWIFGILLLDERANLNLVSGMGVVLLTGGVVLVATRHADPDELQHKFVPRIEGGSASGVR